MGEKDNRQVQGLPIGRLTIGPGQLKARQIPSQNVGQQALTANQFGDQLIQRSANAGCRIGVEEIRRPTVLDDPETGVRDGVGDPQVPQDQLSFRRIHVPPPAAHPTSNRPRWRKSDSTSAPVLALVR